MVERINGSIRQGVWVEQDVRFVQLTSVSTTYLTDLVDDADVAISGTGSGAGLTQRIAAVGSDLEVALQSVAARGTLLGVNVTSDTVIEAMIGYAGAFTTGNTEAVNPSVELEVTDEIIANSGASDCAIAVFAGFGGALPGTPA